MAKVADLINRKAQQAADKAAAAGTVSETFVAMTTAMQQIVQAKYGEDMANEVKAGIERVRGTITKEVINAVMNMVDNDMGANIKREVESDLPVKINAAAKAAVKAAVPGAVARAVPGAVTAAVTAAVSVAVSDAMPGVMNEARVVENTVIQQESVPQPVVVTERRADDLILQINVGSVPYVVNRDEDNYIIDVTPVAETIQ